MGGGYNIFQGGGVDYDQWLGEWVEDLSVGTIHIDRVSAGGVLEGSAKTEKEYESFIFVTLISR